VLHVSAILGASRTLAVSLLVPLSGSVEVESMSKELKWHTAEISRDIFNFIFMLTLTLWTNIYFVSNL
jgi:hypothetical protein